MNSEKSGRRSSILKPPKARNPLSDLDLEQQQNGPDVDATTTTFDKNKRVSFSATKGIALFTMTDHGKTIWHGVYEEPNANMTTESAESTDMAESLVQKLEASQQQISQNIANNTKDSITPTECNDEHERCMNISAMIGDLAKFYPKKAILESTNPSMIDHTEALINYKIADALPAHSSSSQLWDSKKPVAVVAQETIKTMDSISNEESSCEMSITQVMSVDIKVKETPKPLSVNTYVYPNVNKENWVQDKENISIPLNINTYEKDVDLNKYSILNQAQLKRNSLSQNNKVNEQNCDLDFTNAISKMIEDIENNPPNYVDNVKPGLKRKSSDNLDEMLPESISDKRKTIIFDCKMSDCNMSITSIVPSNKSEKHTENLAINENLKDVNNVKRKSAFINQKDLVIKSSTNIVPSDNLFNTENKLTKGMNSIENIKKTEYDISMTDFLPNVASTQKFNIDKKKLNDMIYKTGSNEQKTIIFDQNAADCDVSMTNVLTNINLHASEKKFNANEKNNGDKRKTIIFNRDEAGCNMSMTTVLPNNDLPKTDIENMLCMGNMNNDKRKTIVFDQDESVCNMSMTTVLPSVGPTKNDQKSTQFLNKVDVINNEKRKTIIFDQEESVCNMSMTTVLPSFGQSKNDRKSAQFSNNTKLLNEKRKTIIFDQEKSVCNMSMTSVFPTIDLPKTDIGSMLCMNMNNDKRKTIVFDQDQSVCNMSMTTVLPSISLSKNDRKSTQFINNTEAINNEKQKTIVFDQEESVCNMSMTTVLPSAGLSKNDRKNTQFINNREAINNEKRKTIVFDQEESVCNMSMTSVLPSASLSKNDRKSTQFINNTEAINNEKRKTIVFDQENPICNMSMTTVLPSVDLPKTDINNMLCMNNMNNDKRKTIIFNEESVCNMSMTSVLPSFGQSKNDQKSTKLVNNTVAINGEKQKTIVFDQEESICNMSITSVLPSFGLSKNVDKSIYNVENINNEKKKTIIIDHEEANCYMSMTDFISIDNLNKDKDMNILVDKLSDNNRETIIFDPNESKCNISLTTILPCTLKSKENTENDEKFENTTNEKRKTVIFDHKDTKCNMSVIKVSPHIDLIETGRKSIIENNNLKDFEEQITDLKQKTIIFNQSNPECDISMTNVLPPTNITDNIKIPVEERKKSFILNKSGVKFNMSVTDTMPSINIIESDKKTIVGENEIMDFKQKTIIFDKNGSECNISLTNISLPANKVDSDEIIENENNITRKTIIVDENDVECDIPISNIQTTNSSVPDINKSVEKNYISNSIEKSLNEKSALDFDHNEDLNNVNASCVEKNGNALEKETEFKISKATNSNDCEEKLPQLDSNNAKENDDFIIRRSVIYNVNDAECDMLSISQKVDMSTEFGTPMSNSTLSLNTSIPKKKLPASPLNHALTKKRKTSLSNKINTPMSVINKTHDRSLNIVNENETSKENSVIQSRIESVNTMPKFEESNVNKNIAERSILKENFVQNDSIKQEEDWDMEVSYYVSNPIATDPNNVDCKNLDEAKLVDNTLHTNENMNHITLNKTKSFCNMSVDCHGNDSKLINVNDVEGIVDDNSSEIKEKSIKLDLSTQQAENIVHIEQNSLCDSIHVQKVCDKSTFVGAEENNMISNSVHKNCEIELRYEDNFDIHESSPNVENSLKSHEITLNTLTGNMETCDINKRMTIIKNEDLNTNDVSSTNISMKNADLKFNDEENHIETSFQYKENSINFKNFAENENFPKTSYINDSNRFKNKSFSFNKSNSQSSTNSSNNKLLVNISDISLVDTSRDSEQRCEEYENNSIFSDSNSSNSKNNSVSTRENRNSKCSQEEIPQRTTENVLQDINSLELNKFDCRSQHYNEAEWSFLLCQDSLILKIQFFNFGNRNFNAKTAVSDIILEPSIGKKISSEMLCARIAMINQLPISVLKSICENCDDVPQLLLHCSDISKKARSWVKLLKFLYLQHGLQYENEKLSFQVANGLLQCIWEIVIDVKNLPYATPENIRINVICGESSIAESTFESLIEKVDCNWEYLKNLTDNLYDFIRKLSRKDLLNYNMCC